jgi:hypothetical protein
MQLARWIVQRWSRGADHCGFELGPDDLPLHSGLQFDQATKHWKHLAGRQLPVEFTSSGCWCQHDDVLWAVKSSRQPVQVCQLGTVVVYVAVACFMCFVKQGSNFGRACRCHSPL